MEDFSDIGEEKDIVDEVDSSKVRYDFDVPNVRINKDGKKIRGRDLSWVKKVKYDNPKKFHDSNLIDDLKENYTAKRKRNYAYASVHNYVCKFSQRCQYLPCKKEIRIIFPCESEEVLVEEAGQHEHVLHPGFIYENFDYKWGKLETEIIVDGIQNRTRPKAMLRNMRDRNCFKRTEEPTLIQLYNKISHMKKLRSSNFTEPKEIRNQSQQNLDNNIEANNIDEQSKPLDQKRKRGRPKKLPEYSELEAPVVMIMM